MAVGFGRLVREPVIGAGGSGEFGPTGVDFVNDVGRQSVIELIAHEVAGAVDG